MATPTPTPVACGTLQSRINAAPVGSTLTLIGCSFTAGATVSKSMTIVGGSITVAGSATPGLTVAASNVTIDGMTITGPQNSAYVASDYASGIYTHDPISNLTIKNSRVSNFGHDGMLLDHVTNLVVEGNTVTDIAYAGIAVLSGIGGRITNNLVERVGVIATGLPEDNGIYANSYGIVLEAMNPAVDPPCSDFVVSGNTVNDVPKWHAFDTHNGQRITFTGNTVRRSRSAFFITAAGSPRATDVDVNGNTIYGFAGSAYGITFVFTTGGYNRNNQIIGWPAGREIYGAYGTDGPGATPIALSVSGNQITR